MRKGTPLLKQQAFARAVFSGLPGTQALEAAGYKPVAALASRLLKHPAVVAELDVLRSADRTHAVAKRRECLELLTRHVRADITNYMDDSGRMDLAAVKKVGDSGKSSAVKRVRVTKNTSKGFGGTEHITETVEVEMQDQHGAVDRLARMLGWNKAEKINVNHNLSVSTLTDAQIEAEFLAIARAKISKKKI